MARVELYPRPGPRRVGASPRRRGVGLFAAALMAALPELAVEEEGRLGDPRLRDAFIERLFAHRRVRRLFAGAWDLGGLVGFHAAERMLLLAHDEAACRALDRLVAGARRPGKDALAARYRAGYVAALARPATARQHARVLRHMAGPLASCLDGADRRELAAAIDDYRRGRVPRDVPIALLHRHARRHRVSALLGQRYLEPPPRERTLRDRIGPIVAPPSRRGRGGRSR
jgi:uncharacterized protein YbgA (DUF1722 family)